MQGDDLQQAAPEKHLAAADAVRSQRHVDRADGERGGGAKSHRPAQGIGGAGRGGAHGLEEMGMKNP